MNDGDNGPLKRNQIRKMRMEGAVERGSEGICEVQLVLLVH